MCFTKPHQLCVAAVMLCLLSLGCTNSGGPTGWQQEGVAKTWVNALETDGNILLAGTDLGVFRKHAGDRFGKLTYSGLSIEGARVADFVIWNEQEHLAAVRYDSVRTQRPTLFESLDGGDSWSAVEVQKPDELEYFTIKGLEREKITNKVYAYVGIIIQSEDKGKTWQPSNNMPGGFAEFVAIDPYHPNQIWTGGDTPLFSPYLEKSTDGGETWQLLNRNIYTGSDGTVRDVILHPDDGQQVLAALGALRRSSDGGESWERLFPGQFGVNTFTHSIQRGTIYTSGFNAKKKVFFARSSDFGDSWEMIEYENGPADIVVNDMVAAEADGREVLYLATNKGVYSYWFKN